MKRRPGFSGTGYTHKERWRERWCSRRQRLRFPVCINLASKVNFFEDDILVQLHSIESLGHSERTYMSQLEEEPWSMTLDTDSASNCQKYCGSSDRTKPGKHFRFATENSKCIEQKPNITEHLTLYICVLLVTRRTRYCAIFLHIVPALKAAAILHQTSTDSKMAKWWLIARMRKRRALDAPDEWRSVADLLEGTDGTSTAVATQL